MNGPRYVKQVLQGPLKTFYNNLNAERGGGIIIVEDGAPAHTSKVAQAARAKLGFQTLTHPPNSPDLNPIEPLWGILKYCVSRIPESHKSIKSLWEVVQRVRDELTDEEVTKVIGSMSARVQAVQAAHGYHMSF